MSRGVGTKDAGPTITVLVVSATQNKTSSVTINHSVFSCEDTAATRGELYGSCLPSAGMQAIIVVCIALAILLLLAAVMFCRRVRKQDTNKDSIKVSDPINLLT